MDPDTYIILKRLPNQVPPEIVHICGNNIGEELDRKKSEVAIEKS